MSSLKVNPKLAGHPSPVAWRGSFTVGSTRPAASAGQCSLIFLDCLLRFNVCLCLLCMRLHTSPSTSSRPADTSRSGLLRKASFQLAAKRMESSGCRGLPLSSGHIVVKDLTFKFGLLRRGWTAVKGRTPGCPPASGANRSNGNADEWEYGIRL